MHCEIVVTFCCILRLLFWLSQFWCAKILYFIPNFPRLSISFLFFFFLFLYFVFCILYFLSFIYIYIYSFTYTKTWEKFCFSPLWKNVCHKYYHHKKIFCIFNTHKPSQVLIVPTVFLRSS